VASTPKRFTVPMRLAVAPSRSVFPLFVVRGPPYELVSYEGTAFAIAPGLIVTCFHCVKESPPLGCRYAILEPGQTDLDGTVTLFVRPLSEIHGDEGGVDLATARAELTAPTQLSLSKTDEPIGTEVWTYGYPFTTATRLLDDPQSKEIRINGIYLQGYVTGGFWFQQPGFSRTAVYEVDMPTPRGLSGAPLIRRSTSPEWEVFGVMFGTRSSYTIDEVARVDPATGVMEPEVRNLVQFGMAHHVENLSNLRTPTLNGLSLADYLRTSNP